MSCRNPRYDFCKSTWKLRPRLAGKLPSLDCFQSNHNFAITHVSCFWAACPHAFSKPIPLGDELQGLMEMHVNASM